MKLQGAVPLHKLVLRYEAKQDLASIARYYRTEHGNPRFANKLANEIEEAIEILREFPYAYPVIPTRTPFRHEYRKLPVRDYMVVYWVNERRKTVTISRVLYARRDYKRFL